MFGLHSILFATDFSEWSHHAYHLACSLARDHDARLVALHVIPNGTHQFLTVAQLGQGDTAEQFEHDIRDDLRHHYPDDGTIVMEYRMAQGAAAETIVRVAKETNSDMIVLGTHGRTGLKRMLMGSVAEQVMRHATCPVLTVKNNLVQVDVDYPTDENAPVEPSIVTPSPVAFGFGR